MRRADVVADGHAALLEPLDHVGPLLLVVFDHLWREVEIAAHLVLLEDADEPQHGRRALVQMRPVMRVDGERDAGAVVCAARLLLAERFDSFLLRSRHLADVRHDRLRLPPSLPAGDPFRGFVFRVGAVRLVFRAVDARPRRFAFAAVLRARGGVDDVYGVAFVGTVDVVVLPLKAQIRADHVWNRAHRLALGPPFDIGGGSARKEAAQSRAVFAGDVEPVGRPFDVYEVFDWRIVWVAAERARRHCQPQRTGHHADVGRVHDVERRDGLQHRMQAVLMRLAVPVFPALALAAAIGVEVHDDEPRAGDALGFQRVHLPRAVAHPAVDEHDRRITLPCARIRRKHRLRPELRVAVQAGHGKGAARKGGWCPAFRRFRAG